LFLARRRDRPNESQVSPRAEWYDRNPTQRSVFYSASSVSPHTETMRATYTVPTGKKAMVVVVNAQLRRNTAATTVGRAYIRALTGSVYFFYLTHQNNTAGYREWMAVGGLMMIPTGDILFLYTADESTAGTMDFFATILIIEFDA